MGRLVSLPGNTLLELPENVVTGRIIGCAIEVHQQLGPGLLESVYEEALCIECELNGLSVKRQVAVPLCYKGSLVGQHRLDLLIEEQVVVEIKSVERYDPVFAAQLLTYLKLTGKRVGLLINFNSRLLKDGIRRFILNV